ncbi:NADP-dependent oxidoreductase [Agromyces protaetiae]|uniref:NADP-dependent oxidoreductase n=1 Tax=Agromyces protaetiae TaxID=2509455 RepID=A0A4P6FEG2_9MICO|nr:NADP-dependent oxidoreductase [Agromyces protaetiae]QAY73393.1 NADP-dependent oxidoreductase [Agromyces protaetiae]
MRALVRREYGGPERLEVAELPVPEPRRGEVLVRVAASAINAADAYLLRGEPRIVRLSTGLRRPRRVILGRDVAGVVERVGPDVSGFAPGDRVLGEADGAWAEFAVIPAAALAHVPRGASGATAFSFEVAATLPLPGTTAWQALAIARPAIGPGARVLVTGASGNVGLFVVQLARAADAEVTGLASPSRLDLVRSAGAARVVDRTDPAADPGREYDLVVDLTADRSLGDLVARLAPRGTYVSSSGRGGRVLGPLPRIAATTVRGLFTRRRLRVLAARRNGVDLARIVELAARGDIRPIVDGVIGLDRVADAVARLERGEPLGRVVVRVAEPARPTPSSAARSGAA